MAQRNRNQVIYLNTLGKLADALKILKEDLSNDYAPYGDLIIDIVIQSYDLTVVDPLTDPKYNAVLNYKTNYKDVNVGIALDSNAVFTITVSNIPTKFKSGANVPISAVLYDVKTTDDVIENTSVKSTSVANNITFVRAYKLIDNTPEVPALLFIRIVVQDRSVNFTTKTINSSL